MSDNQNKIIVFQEKEIRHVWHNDEWWFAIVDVIEVLTENTRPRKYWNDLTMVPAEFRAEREI